MINPGKVLEDEFQNLLVLNNIKFTREGSKRNYGVKYSSKGKYDFDLQDAAVELKSILKESDLRMPWQYIKSPILKEHQFKALRQAYNDNKLSGIIIHYREKKKLFWLNIIDLNDIIIEFGMVRCLKIIHLEKYGTELKELSDWIKIYDDWRDKNVSRV